jgi:hypothetical protein
MKHFQLIRSGVAVRPLLDELAAVTDAWDQQTGRQDKVRVQREALAIPLRGLRKSRCHGRARRDVQESRWTSGSPRFPGLCTLISTVAEELDCEPGRAKLVSLPAGRRVYPHIDRGEYYRLHERHHLVLRSSLGSWLRAGDEEVRMHEGELWWFDNRAVHEAFNDGGEDRIHLIFDLLPRARLALAREQLREARRSEEGTPMPLCAAWDAAQRGAEPSLQRVD